MVTILKKLAKHEKFLLANIADYIGISLQDMKRSNKLVVDGKVLPFIIKESNESEETIESMVNMFLTCSIYELPLLMVKFHWYCVTKKKTTIFYNTVTIFWMSHFNFLYLRRSRSSICRKHFWINSDHIIYAISVNKSILQNLDAVIDHFGLDIQETYNAIVKNTIVNTAIIEKYPLMLRYIDKTV
jgi:hypothetical protein